MPRCPLWILMQDRTMARPKPTDQVTKRLISKLKRMEMSCGGKKTTGWEKTFLKEVKERVSRFGSAFCDEEKGDLNQSLSIRQYYKMREIGRKIHHRDTKIVKRKS